MCSSDLETITLLGAKDFDLDRLGALATGTNTDQASLLTLLAQVAREKGPDVAVAMTTAEATADTSVFVLPGIRSPRASRGLCAAAVGPNAAVRTTASATRAASIDRRLCRGVMVGSAERRRRHCGGTPEGTDRPAGFPHRGHHV